MQTGTTLPIAILGISDSPERYSYKAYQKLLENGYDNLIGITPKNIILPNIQLVTHLKNITKPVHTLTVYVGQNKLTEAIDDILNLKPKRIILNPGTENQELISLAKSHNIEVVIGCTLVLLSTHQF